VPEMSANGGEGARRIPKSRWSKTRNALPILK